MLSMNQQLYQCSYFGERQHPAQHQRFMLPCMKHEACILTLRADRCADAESQQQLYTLRCCADLNA